MPAVALTTPEDRKAKSSRRAKRQRVVDGLSAAFLLGLITTGGLEWGLIRETVQKANRAWVLVDAIKMRRSNLERDAIADGSYVWEDRGRFDAPITNFGGGLATEFSAAFRLACLPSDKPCPCPAHIHSRGGGDGIILPHHTVTLHSFFRWKDHDALRDSYKVEIPGCSYPDILTKRGDWVTHALYGYGRITYKDQFGEPHTTLACFRYNSRVQAWDKASENNLVDGPCDPGTEIAPDDLADDQG
jgi:hypothetical protein